MGSPKPLLRLPDGRRLIEAHFDALGRRCGPIIVALGARAEEVRPLLTGRALAVENRGWARTGPLDSLLAALAALPGDRALITPVDAPPIRAADLDALLEAEPTAALGWEGRPGHPLYAGPEVIGALRAGARPADGLRALAPRPTVIQASDPDVLLNMNTPEAWARWLRARWG